MLSALNDYKEPLQRLITGTRLIENVPREILLAQGGLDKLADCRKIKCGIFAFKLAFRKDSNCLPRHVLEAAETWLSLAPDRYRISAMFSACPPSRHCLHSPALNLSATHHTTDLPGREHSHSLAYLLLLCSAFHPSIQDHISNIINIMQYIQRHKHYAI